MSKIFLRSPSCKIRKEIEWTIEEAVDKISAFVSRDELLSSPKFSVVGANGKAYDFTLDVTRCRGAGAVSVAVGFECSKKVTGSVRMFFVDRQGVAVKPKKGTLFRTEEWTTTICSMEWLKAQKDNLMIDNALTIKCDLDLIIPGTAVCIDVGKRKNASAFDLGPELWTKAKAGDKTDFSLVSGVDGERFPCHKFVLRMRSSVLCEIIENAEEGDEEIVIPEMDKDLLGKFLEFIYTNNDAVVTGSEKALLAAAYKYDVACLKEASGHALVSSLTAANVIGVLKFFDRHNSDNSGFAADALQYAVAHLVQVIRTEAWDEAMAEQSNIVARVLQAAKQQPN